MNEIQERKIDSDEKNNQESDLDNFYRGTYRRGARRKTKGNFTLFIVVAMLVVIVIAGIVFAVKTFMPPDSGKTNTNEQNNSSVINDVETVISDASGFDRIIEQYTLLNEDNLLAETDEFLFADGLLNHCQLDFDGDDARELLMITSTGGHMPEISVYEEGEAEVKRNAYYVYPYTLVSKDENAKSEIYISEIDDKQYICVEKYSFDDFSWDIEILNYDDGFESIEKHSFSSGEEITDELKEKFKGYGIEYTALDYSEAMELKMNGDSEEGKIILCSFEIKDGELKANIG